MPYAKSLVDCLVEQLPNLGFREDWDYLYACNYSRTIGAVKLDVMVDNQRQGATFMCCIPMGDGKPPVHASCYREFYDSVLMPIDPKWLKYFVDGIKHYIMNVIYEAYEFALSNPL